MKRIRKGIVIGIVILLCLCASALAMWCIQSAGQNIREASADLENPIYETPIDAYKTAREQLRSMQKAQLNDIAHGADTDAELAAMAQRQLLDLCKREEQELNLEGILQMRGFSKPVAIVQDHSVNILIQTDLITQQDSRVILDLVCRETGISSGNVKIIPIN